MKLLDRYLQDVKQYLPKGQQDDIIRELAENLRSQMEDQEAELGRPLTEAEEEAILKQHGPPMAVASRYRGDQRTLAFGRQLIGPALFPLYLRILALNVGLTLVVCVIAAVALTGPGSVPQTIPTIFFHLCIQFAIVTGIFSLVELSASRFPDLRQSAFARTPAVKDEGRIARSQSVAELIVLTVLILWWLGVPYYPRIVFGPGAPIFQLGPGLRILYLALLPLWVAGWVQACIMVLRPRWVRFYSAARVLTTSASLAVVGFSLSAGRWIVIADPSRGPNLYERLIENVNHWFGVGLILLSVVIAVQLAFEIRRLLRLQREPAPVVVSI